MKRISLITLLVGQMSMSSAMAFEPFVVKDIRVEGIQRVSEDAVLQDLPIDRGQKLTTESSSQIIRSLFKTGFFKNVELEKEGQTLIVKLVERPSIGTFELTGIKNKEKVEKILKEHNIIEGRVYDPSILAQAELEIERHYLSQGRYGVKVESTVTAEERNRVAVRLAIYEGDEAKIKEIKIVGNSVFSESKLLKELHHQKTNWLSWYTKADRYAREKLAADIEVLKSYYMDRGYLSFNVDSTQVSLSPDKKHVYLTINVSEGEQFFFSEIILDGRFVVPKEELMQIIEEKIQPGAVFSRQAVWTIKQELEDRLGDEGYSKANIRLFDEINEEKKTVKLEYYVDPFKRITVRKLDFEGNFLTEDVVLRREIEQVEGGWISTKKVNDGKEAIMRAGYASEVNIDTKPVLGKDDQVDLFYRIEEQKTAQFTASIAYSAAEKLIFQVGSEFKNFLGSGKDVSFTFEQSRAAETYSFGYFNPYFTESGIGMGYNLYKQSTSLSRVSSNLFEYATDSYGGDVHWSFRVSQYNYIGFALGYDRTNLKFHRTNAPDEAVNFSDRINNDLGLKEYSTTISFRHNSLDSYLFPSKGLSQGIALRTTMPQSDLKWYRADYNISWFRPIYKQHVLNLSSQLGFADSYGGTPFPFYRHYFLGGADTVRGYRERDLGPRSSKNEPFGGNVKILARAQVISPPPFMPEAKNVRMALFLDGGQVYDTNNKRNVNEDVSRNPNGLRFTAGISLNWNTPIHIPLVISLAKPLNKKEGDSLNAFAFTFGTQFF